MSALPAEPKRVKYLATSAGSLRFRCSWLKNNRAKSKSNSNLVTLWRKEEEKFRKIWQKWASNSLATELNMRWSRLRDMQVGESWRVLASKLVRAEMIIWGKKYSQIMLLIMLMKAPPNEVYIIKSKVNLKLAIILPLNKSYPAREEEGATLWFNSRRQNGCRKKRFETRAADKSI